VKGFEGLVNFGNPEARRDFPRCQFVVEREPPQLSPEARVQSDLLTVHLDALPERRQMGCFDVSAGLSFPHLYRSPDFDGRPRFAAMMQPPAHGPCVLFPRLPIVRVRFFSPQMRAKKVTPLPNELHEYPLANVANMKCFRGNCHPNSSIGVRGPPKKKALTLHEASGPSQYKGCRQQRRH
jgi:hypothetical protein